MGATAAAVAATGIQMHCVDNWTNNIQPMSEEFELPDNTKQEFLKNMAPYSINVHDCEMLSVDRSKIKNVDLFFYDGPHDVDLTAKAVRYFAECLADTAIMIFDDANWEGPVDGANFVLNELGAKITYKKLILNSEENAKEWWNGLYVLVVNK
jgi:hypothetical protein